VSAGEEVETAGAAEAGMPQPRYRRALVIGGAVIVAAVLAVSAMRGGNQNAANGLATNTSPADSAACEFKPLRQDQADSLIKDGAIIAYERNGGPECIDELYSVYPDGRIVGDDGSNKIEKQVPPEDVEQLLTAISDRNWFTDEMYDTWHTPCGQCFAYYISVSHQGKEKAVQAVDGGTDAPADYWQVVSLINGVIPKFSSP
jgi:hypothetical protein